jgi:hypothetical protein
MGRRYRSPGPTASEAPVSDALDFSGDYDFAKLRPALAQVFFVGDGRASDGSVQRFRVPKGAARLYLGFADAFAFHGPPGFYDDNRGSFQLEVKLDRPSIDKGAEPSAASAAAAGVRLVLVATRASNVCCRVFMVNPSQAEAKVICTLLALDPSGRVIYSGFVPGSPPSHRRPSGLDAPPGRQGHGLLQLPIDLNQDSYTAPCRSAAWHGGSAI